MERGLDPTDTRDQTMTSEAKPRIKITYATLKADNEDLHRGFEEAVARVRAELGAHHRNYVNGAWRDGDGAFELRSPIDRDLVLGTFARGTTADVSAAVAAARAAQPAWAARPWQPAQLSRNSRPPLPAEPVRSIVWRV